MDKILRFANTSIIIIIIIIISLDSLYIYLYLCNATTEAQKSVHWSEHWVQDVHGL